MEGDDPLDRLRSWLAEAEPRPWARAMTLATSSPDARPSARAVVLRRLDDRGLVFCSDRESRKGRELAANPEAAAVLLWPETRRQARIEGTVEELPAAAADDDFAEYPPECRLAVWAWPQGQVVRDDEELKRGVEEARARHGGAPDRRPPRWTSYRLVPFAVELWEERADFLHYRMRYRKDAEDGWVGERLAP